MVPSIRSRRDVPKGGPLLFVASMQPYFEKVFAWLLVGGLAGWTAAHPPPPRTLPHRKETAQGWPQKRRQALVLHGLDGWAYIGSQLESRWTFTSDCLDASVGRLLIPTRRGVGGFNSPA